MKTFISYTSNLKKLQVKSRNTLISTDNQLSDFVVNSEAAFSREHTQWTARKMTNCLKTQLFVLVCVFSFQFEIKQENGKLKQMLQHHNKKH
ncbi:hypothetical protein [Desulfobacter curvatus]|uniref:hypothetical protein n=1 Tax=Desulfobacter curvatus TaxID=2290 RepID=UPI00039BFEFD|nr:hypothetical protein [Desulfobacter curvatus]